MFVGRNDPCPCGSGKKYKRCCGAGNVSAASPATGYFELVRAGMALMQAGQLDAAERNFQQALSRAPGDAGIYNLLGMVALYREQFAEAAKHFQKAIARNGKEPEYFSHLAHAQRGLGRFAEAEGTLRKALSLNPAYFEARHNLGNLLEEMGQKEESIVAYQQALKLRPDDPESLQELGEVLLKAAKWQEAEASFRRILVSHPQHAMAYCGLGDALVEQGHSAEAAEIYQCVVSMPNLENAVLSRFGTFLIRQGKFAEAEKLFREAIQSRGEQPEFYFGLSACHKFTAEDRALLDKIGLLANAQHTMNDNLAAAYYAIGKANDDLKDYARAFQAYRKANDWYGDRASFSQKQYAKEIDETLRFFDSDCLARAGWRSESDLPILIVGMPRSGTTLTEQIISSHPLVHGAGELTFWADIKQELRNAGFNTCLNDAWAERVAQDYLHELNKFPQDARRVTDKLPGNYMNLGLIHRLFPRAKIIHCKRNPVDTCLSIYFQHFGEGHNYRFFLENLAFVYREYRRLMQHWRSILPAGSMLEIQYEDLVANQEEESRRLIEFCGLGWDERCLEFYKAERQVKTASKWQVRQPIYKTSKERWRNYEPWIKPLIELLEEDKGG